MKNQDLAVEEQVDIFDPTKKYKWEENTEFKLNGIEFSILYNGLASVINAESFNVKMALALMDMFKVTQNLLIEKVNSNEITEKTD